MRGASTYQHHACTAHWGDEDGNGFCCTGLDQLCAVQHMFTECANVDKRQAKQAMVSVQTLVEISIDKMNSVSH